MEMIRQYEPLWGSWYVEEKIGSGGFGAVYKVSKQVGRVKEYAAVKLIRNIISESQIKEMRKVGMSDLDISRSLDKKIRKAEDEIVHMSRLKGISEIVNIDDFSIRKLKDGSGYDILIRMELLTSLDDYLMEHFLTKEQVYALGLDICTALEYCEKEGIVHKDIKPSNIFINPKIGKYKLGDFGLARKSEHSTVMSNSGTSDFISPEVFQMKKASYDSDIYCLGLTMYTLINHNRLPFDPPYPDNDYDFEDRMESIGRRLNGEELPPPDGDRGHLWWVIRKACQFDREKRYQHASKMKQDLLDPTLTEYGISGSRSRVDSMATVDSANSEKSVSWNIPAVNDRSEYVTRVERQGNPYRPESSRPPMDPPPADPGSPGSAYHTPPSGRNSAGRLPLILGAVAALALISLLAFLILPGRRKEADVVQKAAETTTAASGEVTEAVTEAVSPATTEAAVQTTAEEQVQATQQTGPVTIMDMSGLNAGDTCTFGRYEQDNDLSDGPEAISWRVLDKKVGKLLLLSEYALDAKPFHERDEMVTWETCSLRKWLNHDFYETAFAEEEQVMIPASLVTADTNPDYDTDQGNDTRDKVFLLSVKGAGDYFQSEKDRICRPTDYAVNNGIFNNMTDGGPCWWWLRTAGENRYLVIDIWRGGGIDTVGDNVYLDLYGVRPAIWVAPGSLPKH